MRSFAEHMFVGNLVCVHVALALKMGKIELGCLRRRRRSWDLDEPVADKDQGASGRWLGYWIR